MLLDLGYDVTGLYLGLGIGGYSDRSGDATKAFAAERDAELIVVDLERDYGYDIPTAGRKGSRSTCAVCGLSKRYVFNRAALEGGFDVIATGHNLDDEAATLLGNTLRWQTEYIARQTPALPGKEGMVKKVKPLFRLSELETAAYAFLRGIDYVVEECPLVAGNTQLRYKDAMNAIESTSPGTKAQFFLGYLERGRPLFTVADDAVLSACERCGQPTTGRFCAFCRARAQILGSGSDHLRMFGPWQIETWWSSSPMRSCPRRSTGERRERVRAGRARDARGSARPDVSDDVADRWDVPHAQRHAAA